MSLASFSSRPDRRFCYDPQLLEALPVSPSPLVNLPSPKGYRPATSDLILLQSGIKKLFRTGQSCSILLMNHPAPRIWHPPLGAEPFRESISLMLPPRRALSKSIPGDFHHLYLAFAGVRLRQFGTNAVRTIEARPSPTLRSRRHVPSSAVVSRSSVVPSGT